MIPSMKIVVYKDGSWVCHEYVFEFENDPDYLTTIDINDALTLGMKK